MVLVLEVCVNILTSKADMADFLFLWKFVHLWLCVFNETEPLFVGRTNHGARLASIIVSSIRVILRNWPDINILLILIFFNHRKILLWTIISHAIMRVLLKLLHNLLVLLRKFVLYCLVVLVHVLSTDLV